jgi:glycerophosphoryl diester phosphodiesterase
MTGSSLKSGAMNHPLLLGHRGARGKTFPENSLTAFDFALAEGCDGFEFDVRMMAGDEAVISHDPIQGRQRKAAAKPASLPRFREVLERYRKTAFLDIEIKVKGAEAIAVELLREFPPARGFVVSSFLPDVLRSIHSLNSRIPLGLICETHAQLARWKRLPVEYVIPQHRLFSQSLVAELKATQKKILVWTVNAPAEMKRFAKLGVDGIISDHPGLLASTLGGCAK